MDRRRPWHPPSQLAEKRYLTRREIDSAAPNNPVYLRTVGHFSMANSLALQKAGIDKDTANPSGGSFERDAAGDLTGVLIETAIDRVEKAVPPWTEEDEIRQFKLAEGVLNSYGITSTVEGATEARDIRTLQKIAMSGEATLRVGLMFRPEPPAEMSAWEAIISGNGASSGFGDEWLKFAGIKIFYDGGMPLKTALMRDAYPGSHDDYHGNAQQTPERLKQLVSICNRYNWRVGVHVVGDRGIDEVLDAFEAADKEKSIRDRRFILIHASLIRPEQMERAHKLGVRVDFQNVFMWDKAATVERFLGHQVADRAVPAKTLIDVMGLDNLGAGTDFPVNPINPLLNMYIMVTRRDPNGNVYGASEAITREQALRLYTSAAARYTFEESIKGTLEPGKLADMAVLSADYMTVSDDQIKDIQGARDTSRRQNRISALTRQCSSNDQGMKNRSIIARGERYPCRAPPSSARVAKSENREPRESIELTSRRCPRMPTASRTMKRPMPRLSGCSESRRVNASKTRGICSPAIPIPVSYTSIRTSRQV